MILDNFMNTEMCEVKSFQYVSSSFNTEHLVKLHELIKRVKFGGLPLIPFESIVNTTRPSFDSMKSMHEHNWNGLW